MKKTVLLIVLLTAAVAFGQGGERISQATQNSGGFIKAIPGAEITVCTFNTQLVCSTTVSIYSNSTLTLPLSNPFHADANGNFYYYVASGSYVEKISSPGTTPATAPITVIGSSSAAAGGTSGQVQYNNAGALGGFTVSGDATLNTSTGVLTLATVNSNVGTCGDSSHIPQVTLNAKGLTTACTPISVTTGGTVTTFTSGNLSPLFTTSVATASSTPALSFTLSNFSADNIFGNFTGGSAPPSTQAIPACANDGVHALVYVSHVLTCGSITGTGNTTSTSLSTDSLPKATGPTSLINSLFTDSGSLGAYSGISGFNVSSGPITVGSSTPLAIVSGVTSAWAAPSASASFTPTAGEGGIRVDTSCLKAAIPGGSEACLLTSTTSNGPSQYVAALSSNTTWTITAATHLLGTNPVLGALRDASGNKQEPLTFNHDGAGNVTITVAVAAAYTVELVN